MQNMSWNLAVPQEHSRGASDGAGFASLCTVVDQLAAVPVVPCQPANKIAARVLAVHGMYVLKPGSMHVQTHSTTAAQKAATMGAAAMLLATPLALPGGAHAMSLAERLEAAQARKEAALADACALTLTCAQLYCNLSSMSGMVCAHI
jgi:hypothetical protein